MRSEEFKEIILSNEKLILDEINEIILRENLSFPEEVRRVCALYGVRRSGKSYILFDLFRKYRENALYIDFEDERLNGFQLKDFEKLRESFLELKPHLINQQEIVYLLDEVQNIEGWEKFSRRMIEKEKAKVFVTGSSSKMMPQEIHTSLRGRSWGVSVYPFSFREYSAAKKIDIKDPDFVYGTQKVLLKNCFSDYLQWGGFPEVSFLESIYEKRKVLNEYLSAMFFKDLVERFDIKNVTLLDVLKEKLFSSFSSKYSLTSFCKQYKDKFPFSKDSVFAYSRYFLESLLIFEVKKLSESSYQRSRNPAKTYLVDTGLARKVTSDDWGRLLENVVFLELKRKGYEIFYFEDKHECDFVVKDPQQNKWIAYQVVWQVNDKTKEREINGLIEACEYLGLKTGMILTYDEKGEKKIGRVNVKLLPVREWLLAQNV